MNIALARVSFAVVKHDQKQPGEERVYFTLQLKSGQELKTGAWRQILKERMEELCLLASSSRLAKLAFLYNPGPNAQK